MPNTKNMEEENIIIEEEDITSQEEQEELELLAEAEGIDMSGPELDDRDR